MNWVFLSFLWLMGIWDDGGVVDRMRARAKCRRISVQRQEVVIRFTSEEDAKLFAEDLRNFVKE
jgi:hypothetical protein